MKKPDFLVHTQISISKQLQLLPRSARRLHFFVVENLHTAKLFVRHAHDSDLSMFRQNRFHPFYVNLRVFHTSTMSQIYRELEHSEAVVQQLLAKLRRSLALLFCISRQIEKHQNPHNPIFAEPVHQSSMVG